MPEGFYRRPKIGPSNGNVIAGKVPRATYLNLIAYSHANRLTMSEVIRLALEQMLTSQSVKTDLDPNPSPYPSSAPIVQRARQYRENRQAAARPDQLAAKKGRAGSVRFGDSPPKPTG